MLYPWTKSLVNATTLEAELRPLQEGNCQQIFTDFEYLYSNDHISGGLEWTFSKTPFHCQYIQKSVQIYSEAFLHKVLNLKNL